MLPHKKSTKDAAASETSVMKLGWTSGPENSTLHFPLVPKHTGMSLGIVDNSRDGEGLEGWRRSALQLDPRASSTAEGSLEEPQVLDGLRDTESNGLVTLHMQVVTLRHRLIMHVSSRDTFIQAKAEVQDIARAR